VICHITREEFCPKCGGVYFAGATILYEHHDSLCSFRWRDGKWVPKELSPEGERNRNSCLEQLKRSR